jgi:putative ABC transport system substrate-binding protein
MTFLACELVGKRVELLKEAVPWVSRVAVLANPAHPGEQSELRETQSTARALGTTLHYLQVRLALLGLRFSRKEPQRENDRNKSGDSSHQNEFHHQSSLER